MPRAKTKPANASTNNEWDTDEAVETATEEKPTGKVASAAKAIVKGLKRGRKTQAASASEPKQDEGKPMTFAESLAEVRRLQVKYDRVSPKNQNRAETRRQLEDAKRRCKALQQTPKAPHFTADTYAEIKAARTGDYSRELAEIQQGGAK